LAKLSNLTETASIGRGAEPQPEEMTDADRSAQNASMSACSPLTSRPTIAAPRPRRSKSRRRGVDPSQNNAGHAAGAGAGRRQNDDPGYVLAPIEEVAAKPKLLFDQAPPLNLDSSSEPSTGSKVEKAGDIQNASDDENVSRVEKEPKSRVNESISNCLVKVDGRVLINRSCQVLGQNNSK